MHRGLIFLKYYINFRSVLEIALIIINHDYFPNIIIIKFKLYNIARHASYSNGPSIFLQ